MERTYVGRGGMRQGTLKQRAAPNAVVTTRTPPPKHKARKSSGACQGRSRSPFAPSSKRMIFRVFLTLLRNPRIFSPVISHLTYPNYLPSRERNLMPGPALPSSFRGIIDTTLREGQQSPLLFDHKKYRFH